MSLVFTRSPVRTGLAITLLAGLALVAAPRAPLADAVVARVEGVEIRESDVKILEEDVSGSLPPMSPEQRKDYLITYLADMILLARHAEREKLAQGDAFQRRMQMARNKVLMDALLERTAATAASEAAMRKVYDDTVKTLAQEQEVRARHILVETEDEAKEVLKQLRAGGDFAALAKAKSKDPGAAEGGDLGYFTKDQMVAEFAEVAFKTPKGQLSEPVKTQFGWHVILVEDQRNRQPPSFDEVKPQIAEFVQRRAQAELVVKVREGAKIERVGAPAAPAAPAGAAPAQPAPAAPAQPAPAAPTQPQAR